jgi:hypothetical protein
MKRTILLWIVGVAFVAAAVGGATYFYFHFVAEYATAHCYLDTAMTPVTDLWGRTRGFTYESRPGRVTVSIARGEPGSFFATDTGSHEQVDIDIPFPADGQRVDLGDGEVRIAFFAAHGGGMVQWEIGTNGAKGWLEIESANPSGITARYYVVVDAYCERFTPTHREMVFQGRATFRPRPRPDGERPGKLRTKPQK